LGLAHSINRAGQTIMEELDEANPVANGSASRIILPAS